MIGFIWSSLSPTRNRFYITIPFFTLDHTYKYVWHFDLFILHYIVFSCFSINKIYFSFTFKAHYLFPPFKPRNLFLYPLPHIFFLLFPSLWHCYFSNLASLHSSTRISLFSLISISNLLYTLYLYPSFYWHYLYLIPFKKDEQRSFHVSTYVS